MPAKKAAKKAAKKSVHHPAHDLRRAYEHLGRVDILEGALAGSPFRDVSALAKLAQEELAASHFREAADLLRAAEHICFAPLAPEDHAGTAAPVSSELKAAIAAELDHLTGRAEDNWSESESQDIAPHATIAAVYTTTIEQARLAFTAGGYRPALELARAAEALAHIARRGSARLAADGDPRQRLAS
jgi:hypothetical protein